MKLMMLFVCLGTGVLLQAQDIKKADARMYMEKTVLEFLAEKRFYAAEARKISEDYGLFIGKCKICEGSRAAFAQYAAAPPDIESMPLYRDTALFSANKETKLKALEKLVSLAVTAGLKKHGFNKKQRKAMLAKLEAEKQRSSMLTNGGYCASCTGSCKKPGT